MSEGRYKMDSVEQETEISDADSMLSCQYQTHSGRQLFECTICLEKFTTQRTLTIHMRVHSSEKQYESKEFSRQDTLDIQIERIHTHSGGKPFECTVCQKTFSRKNNLPRHMKIHTGEKPFECTLCQKAYTTKTNLNDHMRIHSGEKPFSCSICHKKFTLKRSLTRHMIGHSGEDSYECFTCGRKFKRKHNLHQHIKVHCSKQLYECKECKRPFTTNLDLSEHKLHHLEQPVDCGSLEQVDYRHKIKEIQEEAQPNEYHILDFENHQENKGDVLALSGNTNVKSEHGLLHPEPPVDCDSVEEIENPVEPKKEVRSDENSVSDSSDCQENKEDVFAPSSAATETATFEEECKMEIQYNELPFDDFVQFTVKIEKSETVDL